MPSINYFFFFGSSTELSEDELDVDGEDFFFFLAPPFLIQASALKSPYLSAELESACKGRILAESFSLVVTSSCTASLSWAGRNSCMDGIARVQSEAVKASHLVATSLKTGLHLGLTLRLRLSLGDHVILGHLYVHSASISRKKDF